MDVRAALAQAKSWAANTPNVTGVYWGFKYRGGIKTGEVAIVVSVRRKRAPQDVAEAERVPTYFADVVSDVVENLYRALALTADRRPCPAGFSIGHYLITAGTFGLPVHRGSSEAWLALTNNHVGANSNAGSPGDRILQPGKYDGGIDPDDWWATLTEYVQIHFVGEKLPKKSSRVGQAWWAAIKALGDTGAKLTSCPNRVHIHPESIDQPTPNLVDAALCTPRDPSVIDPCVYGVGTITAVRDLVLGDKVTKVGRTTERTYGTVEGVGAQVQVQYGEGQIALFDDQLIIRGDDNSAFSAGGDSGSAILTADGTAVGGLLFAGSETDTIANRFSHVQALLGVRL